MAKRFRRRYATNFPSTNYPRNAELYNRFEKGIDDIDNAVENQQAQIDQLVVSGDSSPAADQARVGADGTVHSSLKTRIDTEYNKLGSELAHTVNKEAVEYHFPDLRYTADSCDCQVIKGYGKTIVVDTGYATQWVGTIKPYLDNLIESIDYLVISHYHPDHMGNVENILNTYDCSNCIALLAPDSSHADVGTKYDDVINALVAAEVSYHIVDENDYTVSINNNFSMRFFNTSPTDYTYYDGNTSDYNDYSMCTEFRHYNQSVLMTGDLSYKGQERVITQGYIQNMSALYKSHHHGFNATIYKPYMEAINPNIIVLTSPSYRDYNRTLNEATFAYLCTLSEMYSCGYTREPIVFYTSSNGLILKTGTKFRSNGKNYHYVNLYVDGSVDADAFEDGTQEHPYRSINSAIAKISNNRNLYYTIYVEDGTYPEAVFLRDVGAAVALVGNIDNPDNVMIDLIVSGNCINAEVRGFKTTKTKNCWSNFDNNNNVKASVEVINSNLKITSCKIAGTWNGTDPHGENVGIFSKFSKVYVRATDISNAGDAIRAESSSHVTVRNCTGSGNDYGYYSASSVIISETGNT